MPSQNSRSVETFDLPEDSSGSSSLLSEGPKKRPKKKKKTMRLVSFNVNSWPVTAESVLAASAAASSSAASATSAASFSSSKAAKDRATSAALARWIGERLRADVLCLQETRLSEEKLRQECKALACLEGYESFWSCAAAPRLRGYSGVATYCRSPQWSPTACFEGEEVLPAMHAFDHMPGGAAAVQALGRGPGAGGPRVAASPSFELEGRLLEVEFGDDLTVINVYAPNVGDSERDGGVRGGVKNAFFRALRRRIEEILARSKERGKTRGVICCGDFNQAPSNDDVFAGIPEARVLGLDVYEQYTREERDALAALMAPPMVDAFRALHPEATATGAAPWARGFTVWDLAAKARQRDEGLRIDFFLVSDNLRVTRCEVVESIPGEWSDHAAVMLEIEVAEGGGRGGDGGGGGAAEAEVSSSVAAAGAAAPLLPRPPPPHAPIEKSSLKYLGWQPSILAMFRKHQQQQQKKKKRAADEAQAAKKKTKN